MGKTAIQYEFVNKPGVGNTLTSDNLMFATGEAIAHLHFLLAKGEIHTEHNADNVIWYRQK